MKRFNKALLAIIGVVCITATLTLCGCAYGSKYDAVNESELILNAVLVSDIHTDNNVMRDRTFVLRKSFSAICSSSDYDLFLCAGDNTNSGVEGEYRTLKGLLDDFDMAERYVFSMGNHDSWHESASPDFAKAKAGFVDFCDFLGYKTDNTYYSTTVNGYHFICTGYDNGRLEGEEQYMSDEQFVWLEDQIAAAMNSKLPIFIVHHQPYENMNELEGLRLKMLIEACAEDYDKPIIVVTGHQHDLNEETFKQEASELYYINLPSLLYTDENGGLAFVMEVYNSEIIFRGRNFVTGEWVDNQQYVIDLRR